jgi:hypothetical protein
MNQFRPLRADEIEVRISTVSEKGVTLLLYKTARTDANLLDEVYGVGGWQNDFKLIDGVLFGEIGVYLNNEWIWKRDAGVESYTEKEKGRASDAFKRAGFKWGIGRELYSAPFIFIPASKCKIEEKNGKKVCYDHFEVSRIEYTPSSDIGELAIKNSKTGEEVYKWFGAKQAVPVKDKVDLSAHEMVKCENCGAVIMPYRQGGKTITPEELAERSKAANGRVICIKCAKEQANADK